MLHPLPKLVSSFPTLQVMLHKESPLGEITLECFLSGAKNVFQVQYRVCTGYCGYAVSLSLALAAGMAGSSAPCICSTQLICPCQCACFQLGFVPVKEDLVVLLARDTEVSHAEYDWDLTKWAPLVQEKELVQWLVKKPSDAEALRARPCNVAQINKLEEMWRTNPSVSLQDVVAVDGSLGDAEPASVQMRYEDAYQYQNIMGPLVKLEADYDRHMKEAQTQENITVRWDMGLNKKRIAYFQFAQPDNEMRLLAGDELLLRHAGDATRAAWQCNGTVVRLSSSEEVGIELRNGAQAPTDLNHGFSVDLVWNSIAYDRMQTALKTFAVDET